MTNPELKPSERDEALTIIMRYIAATNHSAETNEVGHAARQWLAYRNLCPQCKGLGKVLAPYHVHEAVMPCPRCSRPDAEQGSKHIGDNDSWTGPTTEAQKAKAEYCKEKGRP